MPNVSKIYKRLLFSQINNHLEGQSSKDQYGFRQGLSAQYCLIAMLKNGKNLLVRGNILITAKFNAHGFSFLSARLIHSHLSNQKEKTKRNSASNSWEEISLLPHMVNWADLI